LRSERLLRSLAFRGKLGRLLFNSYRRQERKAAMPVEDKKLQVLRDAEAASSISVLPSLLDVVATQTGTRFAAVARVAETRWIACAARDGLALGVAAGDELPIDPALREEARQRARTSTHLPSSFLPRNSNLRSPRRNPSPGSSTGCHVRGSHTMTLPAPYWPSGICPLEEE
jgi:hypothetical protein